jgi:hypothetical protein
VAVEARPPLIAIAIDRRHTKGRSALRPADLASGECGRRRSRAGRAKRRRRRPADARRPAQVVSGRAAPAPAADARGEKNGMRGKINITKPEAGRPRRSSRTKRYPIKRYICH